MATQIHKKYLVWSPKIYLGQDWALLRDAPRTLGVPEGISDAEQETAIPISRTVLEGTLDFKSGFPYGLPGRMRGGLWEVQAILEY